jgi:predicted transposase/invertase (TIGR01784 family)
MAFHLDQPVGIDPCVDVVFLELFGAHERILLDFLNAVLAPATPIVRVSLRPTVHSGAFEGQKAVVLDIEATDASGRVLHVEMQRQAHAALDQRMLYLWARLYAEQLAEGVSYAQLRPVVSVWICEKEPFPSARKALLSFTVREADEGFLLHGDQRVDVLQLSRWARERETAGSGLAGSPLRPWFWFLNEAAGWREVPAEINSPVLEEAMGVLNDFRTDVHKNALYRGRLDAERLEATRQEDMETALAREQAALAREQAAVAREEAAVAREKAAVDEKEAALAREKAALDEKEAVFAEVARLRKELGDRRE